MSKNIIFALMHKFKMKKSILKKLNEVKGKDEYRFEIPNRFADMENSDDNLDINRAWETIRERIFGPKRDEVTGGWRKLHNEELHNLYSSPSIIRMIKSRRLKCAGNVARMGRTGMDIGY
jgi:phosphatidylinositol kinase/protein kinase (PI-3  family)